MRYSIEGEPLPVVICELERNETMITESGAMSWMTTNMQMETTSNGGVGKVFSRMFSGESLFVNKYTAVGGDGTIAFASSFPGEIRAFEIDKNHSIVAQKTAFLAGTEGVDISVFFNKKLGAGLFGGEGFIMQKISGEGLVFLEFDGSIKQYNLKSGQQLIVDSGYLAAMDETCSIDVQTVSGLKNVIFGGEGLFNTVVTGPGNVWLQTMPISKLAATIVPFVPTKSKD